MYTVLNIYLQTNRTTIKYHAVFRLIIHYVYINTDFSIPEFSLMMSHKGGDISIVCHDCPVSCIRSGRLFPKRNENILLVSKCLGSTHCIQTYCFTVSHLNQLPTSTSAKCLPPCIILSTFFRLIELIYLFHWQPNS